VSGGVCRFVGGKQWYTDIFGNRVYTSSFQQLQLPERCCSSRVAGGASNVAMHGELCVSPIEKKRKRSAVALSKAASGNEFCRLVNIDGTGDTSTSNHAKKNWSKRPLNWMIIAEDAEVHGNLETLTKFKSDFDGMTETAAYRRLYKWKKDLKNKKPPSYITRMPTYGKAIDDLLFDDFVRARTGGLPTSDDALRQYLKVHLAAANLDHLLQESGGKYTFGASWAARFCKRHNVGPRRRLTRRTKTSKNQEHEEIEIEIGNNVAVNTDNPCNNEGLLSLKVDHEVESVSSGTESESDNLQFLKITRRNSF
jgi:hypothetical protein